MISTGGSCSKMGVTKPHVTGITSISVRLLASRLARQLARHSGNVALSLRVTLPPHLAATIPASAVPLPSCQRQTKWYVYDKLLSIESLYKH